MTVFDLFSKRQQKLRGEVFDVYVYDNLPKILIVQVVHILDDALGNEHDYYEPKVRLFYKKIVDTLCREYGLFKLPTAEKFGERNYRIELMNYLLQESNIEKQLDVIELTFNVIDNFTRNYQYLQRSEASKVADNAIEELNNRFKEHGIGFQFEGSEIIRVDSELIHVEVVKPALRLLNEKIYQGAQQEFLSAYEHYRHGNHKEALNECLKSFESTMKAICDIRKWSFPPNATAKTLIQVCFESNLVPAFWLQQLTSLRSLLESGIPTGRNKLSGHGHGQGTELVSVPDYLVSYMLHMTASTLVFLVTAEKNIA